MGTEVKDFDSTLLFQAIKAYIQKKHNIHDVVVEEMMARIKNIGINTYEALCEVERVITYEELAMIYSESTGIPFSKTITGQIDEVNNRYIKVNNNGQITFYIWHPLTVKSSGDILQHDVVIIPRDVFLKYAVIRTETSVAENSRDRLLSIIRDAIRQGATDIHIFPLHRKDIYKVVFRVMGDLCEIDALSYDAGRSLATVIINIAKNFTPSLRVDDVRNPQDARIEFTKDEVGQDISVRVSIVWKPDMRSVDIVMRLLYKMELTNASLESLGFFTKHSQILKTVIARNRGIVVVTGATGSGKSRTINTLLSMIPRTRNVLTIEDPIEYILPNGRQFQTIEWEDTRTGSIMSVSFPEFARAFKRHDPDVIFIGELRDKETVDTALHLAKTSHLVFATLHAARATMIPEILIEDYGISREVVADNLLVGVNQILVKRLCDNCKKQAIIDMVPEWVKSLRFPNSSDIQKLLGKRVYFANTNTREHCTCSIVSASGNIISKGYSGRTLFAEVYEFSPDKLSGGVSAYEMEEKLMASGNLLTDAIEKVQAGIVEIGAIQALL